MRASVVRASMVAMLVVSGCRAVPGTEPATPSPVVSPSLSTPGATGTPTPSASASPSPSIAELGYGARIALPSDTELRSHPSLQANVTGTLPAGQVAVIDKDQHAAASGDPIFGPVEADGLTWYPVLIEPTHAVGWAGAMSPTDFVVRATHCPDPSSVTVDALAAMAPGDWLACFAGETLTLTGDVAVSGLGGYSSGNWSPRWLTDQTQQTFIVGSTQRIQVRLATQPGVTMPRPVDQPYVRSRVMVHVDDPAAATCSITGDGAPDAEPAASAGLYCRTQLVIDTIEALGPG